MGLGELIAERCEGLGPARGGERVEPDEQFAVAGDDVAGAGERFTEDGGCRPRRRRGRSARPGARARAVSALQAAMRMAWVICLISASSRTMSGAISARRMRAGTAAAASAAAWTSAQDSTGRGRPGR